MADGHDDMNDVPLESRQALELGCGPRTEQGPRACVDDRYPPASLFGERLPVGDDGASDEAPAPRTYGPMDRRAGNAKACELRPTENSSLVLGNSLDVFMR